MEHLGQFGWLNWTMLVVLLLGTTFIGHRLRGKQTNLRGFFLGNKSMPWWAVAGSLTATRTSALVFIAVPASVYMVGGNLGFMQVVAGAIIGDFIMGLFLIKKYYQEEIYSPYDYIDSRLGHNVSQTCRVLWLLGTVLSQSVRLLATSLVLNVITGLDLIYCIAIMGTFSVIWSVMGGITTVIWTDVIQFCIFLTGAIFAIIYTIKEIPDGVAQIWQISAAQGKTQILDFSLDPHKIYTVWIALFGVTVFELGQLTIDQMFVQRVLTCKNLKDAKKSIYYGAFTSNMTTPILLFVGLCLATFYLSNPLPESVVTMFVSEPDKVFPYFLMTRIPDGISGLIIASIFAAGISTLDSAMTAVSEVCVNGFYRHYFKKQATEAHYLFVSRLMVVFWGIVYSLVAYGMYFIADKGLLALGLSVYAYVYGTLFGIALLSFMGRGSFGAILSGAVLSIASVIYLRLHDIAFFWWYPVATIIQLGVSLLFSPKKRSN